MANRAEEDRVSIWSIGDAERTLFVGMAFAFFLFGMAFALWYIVKNGSVDQAIFDGIKVVGPVGLSAVTLTFFLIEGWHLMIVPVERFREKYRKKYREERFEAGRKAGREEGREEGHQEIFVAIQEAYPDIDLEAIRVALEEIDGKNNT